MLAETERLIIRQLERSDLSALYAIMSKIEVMYAWEYAFNEQMVSEWIDRQIQRYERDGFGYSAVVLKENGVLIGQVGLLRQTMDGKEVIGLGYIFDSNYWHKGYALESARAFAALAFGRFGVRDLHADIRPHNQSSINVAQRLGMKQAGEFVKVVDGKDMPHLVFTLGRDDYLAQKPEKADAAFR